MLKAQPLKPRFLAVLHDFFMSVWLECIETGRRQAVRLRSWLVGWKVARLEGWRVEGWRAGGLEVWRAGVLEGWRAGRLEDLVIFAAYYRSALRPFNFLALSSFPTLSFQSSTLTFVFQPSSFPALQPSSLPALKPSNLNPPAYGGLQQHTLDTTVA